VPGIVHVVAETLAEAREEYGELADLLQEMRGALRRSLRGPEEDLRDQVRLTVQELDAMLAHDKGTTENPTENVQEQAGRISRAIRAALPEVRDLLSEGRLEPAVASKVHTELVSFLDGFLPELRQCLPHPRD
jgi:hypothetical protein